MNKRTFLKTMGALAVQGYLPFKALKPVSDYIAISGIKITSCGLVEVVDPDGSTYELLRFHLQQKVGEELLECYTDISYELYSMNPTIEYIREEIRVSVEAMEILKSEGVKDGYS